MSTLLAVACVLAALRLGWAFGVERGRRLGMRNACEILAGKASAGDSAAEWLRELEVRGERYL